VPYKYIILPKDVRIGDTIIIDPLPKDREQHFYAPFDDKKITVEEITTLPDGCFYFIYGGFDRNSVFVDKDERIEISLKGILKRL